MNAARLHKYILQQAKAQGLDTEAPFPFMLEGNYFDLDWHVLNGPSARGGGHNTGGFLNKINEHRAQTGGRVIGFYSARSQGVFTHPGESWHLHIVFEKEGKAGHIDAISVRKGSLLKLPDDQVGGQ